MNVAGDEDGVREREGVELSGEHIVALRKIQALEKVVGHLIFWIGLVAAIYVLFDGIDKITEKPAWLQVAGLVLTAVALPTVLICITIRLRQRYVDKTHGRTVELEMMLDAKRESSKE